MVACEQRTRMSFEPSPPGYGSETLVKKALFIEGQIGRDFDNIAAVHRVAKQVARNVFKSQPEPESITILDWVFLPKVKGFVLVLTDGTLRSSGCRRKKT